MRGCTIKLIYKYSSNNATGTYTDIRETVGSYTCSMVGCVIIVSFELLNLLVDTDLHGVDQRYMPIKGNVYELWSGSLKGCDIHSTAV